jgi:ABC-type glutathione transport system ATPase component
VAACISPDVLLVDEVLAVGDAAFRQKCMKRIQRLRQSGTAIIFVSHNLYMVQAVCTSVLYLEHGQVKYLGATSEAIDMYERDVHEQRARQFEHSFSEQATTAAGVEISQIQVLDATGSLPQQFQSDQRAEIRIEYVAQEEIERANVVVRIIRSDGLTCCMMRTSLDEVQMSLQPGPGVLSVILEPLQLVGSTYFIDARVTDAADVLVLATGRSKWFYVEGVALSHEEQSGVFEPRRRWNHSSDSSPFVAGGEDHHVTESP